MTSHTAAESKQFADTLRADNNTSVARQYVIVDTQTGYSVAGPFATRVRASRKADRLDSEFGGYRYSVREV